MRDMSADGYALTKHLETTLSAKRRDVERVAHETGVARGDPCTPGTRGGPTLQPSSARQGPLDPPQGERP